jgi:hypothetical protein
MLGEEDIGTSVVVMMESGLNWLRILSDFDTSDYKPSGSAITELVS